MNEYNNDDADILKEQEDADLDTANEENDESESDLAERLAKAETLANNYKIRAEKAEKFAKTLKSEPTPKQESSTAGDLSSKDLYALMDAKVSQDDIDDVVEFAKFKNITVSEALKSPLVKTILNDKLEQRKTAEATNVGSSKRGSNKTSDDVLLSNAKKGILPENEADMERMIKLRLGIK